MACLIGKYNPVKGRPLVDVIVSLDPDEDTAGKVLYKALLDTGANRSSISDELAERENFVSTKTVMMRGIGKDKPETPAYDFFVTLVATDFPQRSVDGEDWDRQMTFEVMDAGSFVKGDHKFDVLIGCDILSRGTFHMSYDGHFVFSV